VPEAHSRHVRTADRVAPTDGWINPCPIKIKRANVELSEARLFAVGGRFDSSCGHAHVLARFPTTPLAAETVVPLYP